MPVSKMSREAAPNLTHFGDGDDDGGSFFDFGEPELLVVEISPEKFLTLKEPSASDLIEISKLSENKKLSDIEATLQTICILHHPEQGQRKLTVKDAKRLTAKQLKKIGAAMSELMGDGVVNDDDTEGEETES
jgi:hypothetical protein